MQFSAKLKAALGADRTYFEPSEDAKMEYPCIVYSRDVVADMHADNQSYHYYQGYQVTHISLEPDSDVLLKLKRLPHSSFQRHYVTSGLNHDVFLIYH